MIEEVYTKIINKYIKLREKINKYDLMLRQELREKIKENWIELNLTKPVLKKGYIAIDGGMYSKDLRVGLLYVVNAEALFYSGNNMKPILKDSIVGILRPGNHGKELVREIMSFLEIRMMTECSSKEENNIDYILMDGSPFKKIEKTSIDISSNEENKGNDVYTLLSEMLVDDEEEIRILILNEKLKLIKKAVTKFGDKILWISKISRSTKLFNLSIPDIVILETFTNSIGYTVPKISEIRIDNEKFNITTTYVRLASNEKVLRLDIFGKKDEKFIEEIINALLPISIRGYPFPLLKVHSDVKVSSKDKRRIIEILGLNQKRIVNWWPDQLS
ncbi:MAG: DNA double-strand break repair nuclease NurA [Sulfolobaceae archaeon]